MANYYNVTATATDNADADAGVDAMSTVITQTAGLHVTNNDVSSSTSSYFEKQLNSNPNPFSHLKMTSMEPLLSITKRTHCDTCGCSYMYYCYKCLDVSPTFKGKPNVTLPIQLHIVKHMKELATKSTALHAKVLAPSSVTMHYWDGKDPNCVVADTPPWDPSTTVLVFPSKDAVSLDELERDSVKYVVVVDGTWQQARKIMRGYPHLSNLRHVKIKAEQTTYWRTQQVPDDCLATIEAIYYFFHQYYELIEKPALALALTSNDNDINNGKSIDVDTLAYDGRYDDLLWYYVFLMQLIQHHSFKERQSRGIGTSPSLPSQTRLENFRPTYFGPEAIAIAAAERDRALVSLRNNNNSTT